MKKIIYAMVILLTLQITVYAAIDDGPWQNRHSSAGAKKAYQFYKNAYENNPGYEASWKFSRAAFHYADVFVNDKGLKKVIFTEGKLAGEKAVEQNPDGVEGHTYLGICLGSWAKANGIFASLRTIPYIFREANKAISINKGFASGAPLLLRGNVYMKVPHSKGGDIDKAIKDFKKAVAMFPDNRKAHGFLAEALIKKGEKAEANKIIITGLAIAYDSSNKSMEDFEIAKLKRLQNSIK